MHHEGMATGAVREAKSKWLGCFGLMAMAVISLLMGQPNRFNL